MSNPDFQHQLTHQLILHDNYYYSKKLMQVGKIVSKEPINDEDIRRFFEYLCLQIPQTKSTENFSDWIDRQTKQFCLEFSTN